MSALRVVRVRRAALALLTIGLVTPAIQLVGAPPPAAAEDIVTRVVTPSNLDGWTWLTDGSSQDNMPVLPLFTADHDAGAGVGAASFPTVPITLPSPVIQATQPRMIVTNEFAGTRLA
ncbi:MAG TPA: hypothetical protein PLV68_00540, partial [Ilumatobacteraceae bacterium]|nr:hypothetical protein [Ilumatobacteraceae bacterium]